MVEEVLVTLVESKDHKLQVLKTLDSEKFKKNLKMKEKKKEEWQMKLKAWKVKSKNKIFQLLHNQQMSVWLLEDYLRFQE